MKIKFNLNHNAHVDVDVFKNIRYLPNYQVILEMKYDSLFHQFSRICHGSIVNQNAQTHEFNVLTASHCVYDHIFTLNMLVIMSAVVTTILVVVYSADCPTHIFLKLGSGFLVAVMFSVYMICMVSMNPIQNDIININWFHDTTKLYSNNTCIVVDYAIVHDIAYLQCINYNKTTMEIVELWTGSVNVGQQIEAKYYLFETPSFQQSSVWSNIKFVNELWWNKTLYSDLAAQLAPAHRKYHCVDKIEAIQFETFYQVGIPTSHGLSGGPVIIKNNNIDYIVCIVTHETGITILHSTIFGLEDMCSTIQNQFVYKLLNITHDRSIKSQSQTITMLISYKIYKFGQMILCLGFAFVMICIIYLSLKYYATPSTKLHIRLFIAFIIGVCVNGLLCVENVVGVDC